MNYLPAEIEGRCCQNRLAGTGTVAVLPFLESFRRNTSPGISAQNHQIPKLYWNYNNSKLAINYIN